MLGLLKREHLLGLFNRVHRFTTSPLKPRPSPPLPAHPGADSDSEDDYLVKAARTADAIAEAAADSDGMATDDDSEPPLMHPTFFQLKAKPPAATSGVLPFPPPPPAANLNVPPIFVMAPDPSAPPPSHPAQVRAATEGWA